MKTYEKPIISVDDGLAEGVYAASGSNEVNIKQKEKTTYYQENGAVTYEITVTGIQLASLTVTFSESLTGAYSGSGTVAYSSNTVTFTYNEWNTPNPSATFTVQTAKLSSLKVTGFTYSKL